MTLDIYRRIALTKLISNCLLRIVRLASVPILSALPQCGRSTFSLPVQARPIFSRAGCGRTMLFPSQQASVEAPISVA